MTLDKNTKFVRRQRKVRRVILENEKHPRLSVYRSNKHIYAQIIEDKNGATLVAASDHLMNEKNKPKKLEKIEKTDRKAGVSSDRTAPAKATKIEMAYFVGEELAKRALKEKISEVVFDKSGYKYHGRVKALAEGARKGGMKF